MFRSDIVVPDIVSCDVFDTLLLRDARSEVSRHRSVARLAAHRLKAELGIVVETAAVLRARIEAQRYAYRALDMLNPRGEVRHAQIVQTMAAMLALCPDGAEILATSERAIEKAQLTPNRQLLRWLAAQAQAGRRIIATSDTWHSAETLAHVFDAVAPEHPITKIYTSADCDATKRSKALFRHVISAERVRPEQILHIGDDAVADLAMARDAGLHCAHVARPSAVRLIRKIDAALSRVRHSSYLH